MVGGAHRWRDPAAGGATRDERGADVDAKLLRVEALLLLPVCLLLDVREAVRLERLKHGLGSAAATLGCNALFAPAVRNLEHCRKILLSAVKDCVAVPQPHSRRLFSLGALRRRLLQHGSLLIREHYRHRHHLDLIAVLYPPRHVRQTLLNVRKRDVCLLCSRLLSDVFGCSRDLVIEIHRLERLQQSKYRPERIERVVLRSSNLGLCPERRGRRARRGEPVRESHRVALH
mmetsp:Transcript_9004/g.29575  ORF Transcript_9004/g.29575 Transcript_9004/m.29575 type:complete len:231 (-) Transcript_9004:116-808(-)